MFGQWCWWPGPRHGVSEFVLGGGAFVCPVFGVLAVVRKSVYWPDCRWRVLVGRIAALGRWWLVVSPRGCYRCHWCCGIVIFVVCSLLGKVVSLVCVWPGGIVLCVVCCKGGSGCPGGKIVGPTLVSGLWVAAVSVFDLG